MHRKANPTDPELKVYDDKQRQLDAEIAELEELPEQLELEMQELARTLPAPDDLLDRAREREFAARAARGQVRNERRTQGQSLALMFLLLAATAALVSWMINLASQ